mgnify:CR=1 FL=1|tara:strand:+ start:4544 stop:4972 length:429 start_codon:yes stop_codon:yes gene_type:complete
MNTKGLTRRLKYYGLGFGLGLILVWATLLKDRDRAAWLPEGRILEFLEEVDMEVTSKAKCQIDCLKLDSTFMDKTFWENATVNFKKSAVKRKPCPEHYIESKLADGRAIALYIENCETCQDCEAERTATLRSLEIEGEVCDC